jgi:hypothetical protein
MRSTPVSASARILLLLTGLVLLGCTKMDDQFLFRLEYDEIIAIPAGLNTVETYTFILKDIPTNYQILLQTNNLSDAAVSTINPGSIRLADELSQLDFSNIEKISLLASTTEFKNEKEIGYLEFVPLNSTNQLQLFPTLVDAKDVFSASAFNLRLKIKLRGFLSASSNIRMRLAMSARKP